MFTSKNKLSAEQLEKYAFTAKSTDGAELHFRLSEWTVGDEICYDYIAEDPLGYICFSSYDFDEELCYNKRQINSAMKRVKGYASSLTLFKDYKIFYRNAVPVVLYKSLLHKVEEDGFATPCWCYGIDRRDSTDITNTELGQNLLKVLENK